MLLCNRVEIPPVPLVHAIGSKEIYNTVELVLCFIKHSNYQWNICGGLKVIDFLVPLEHNVGENLNVMEKAWKQFYFVEFLEKS